jgi:hypothetical protein
MGSTNQVQIMLFTEKLNIVRAESVADASLIFAPSLSVFIRVTPQEIAKQSYDKTGSLPESGTSVGFYIFLICSIDCKSGDNPPCMQRIRSSIRAATGKQLKQSIKVFQSLILYLRLPCC